MSKKRTTIEEAPTVATTPDGIHRYDFAGHASYVKKVMESTGLPVRLLADLTASPPISHLGKILVGLSEMSRRNRNRRLWVNEIDLVRSTLLGVEEVRWHYQAGEDACSEAISEARRAFGMPEPGDGGELIPDDAPGTPWSYAGLDPYFRGFADAFGLSESFVRRAEKSPEVHRVGTRLGELHRRFLAAPKNDEGRPVLSIADRELVRAALENAKSEAITLSVLSVAAGAMLFNAYDAFGLERPGVPPPPNMPECPGCRPILNSTRRTRGKMAPFFA